MTIGEVRMKFLEFYRARGHAIVPSASLVPQNDPTTLFTGSGMQPILPYLLGETHPQGSRIADSQKSFRAEDIDEVGDNRHTTFFEMLGNWSFGDYFKEEQLTWVFQFLTDEIGIDPKRLYVTAFIGDERSDLPKDEEAAELWKKLFASKGIEAKAIDIGSEEDGYRLGMQGGRIFFYDAKKNWWSRAGTPDSMPQGEPGGPDSEIFYDFGPDPAASGGHGTLDAAGKYGAQCHPNCDCGRFLEICNSVFMQYLRKGRGFEMLPKKNVDFGGGLERITAASIGNPDVFATDVFQEIISLLSHWSGKSYEDSTMRRSFRIVADHIRAAVFMLSDGVLPSNTERGYVLRRLIRRASQHAQKLGLTSGKKEDSMLVRAAIIVLEKYQGAYPELGTEEMYKTVTEGIWKEEVQFSRILSENSIVVTKAIHSGNISGNQAFQFSSVLGIPLETIQDWASEHGRTVDVEGWKANMELHRDLSRSGAEQKFRGGLADHSEKTTRLHTAHHLLLRALQIVLGGHVKQRGSNITQERLRIDFSHGAKMTKEEITAVEKLVNEKIGEALPVIRSTLPKDEAMQLGAEQEFGAKYPDTVSVYSIGPAGASESAPRFPEAFSIEFCGGPHVTNTSEVAGVFRIAKEEAVAAGVRRIKAMLE